MSACGAYGLIYVNVAGTVRRGGVQLCLLMFWAMMSPIMVLFLVGVMFVTEALSFVKLGSWTLRCCVFLVSCVRRWLSSGIWFVD